MSTSAAARPNDNGQAARQRAGCRDRISSMFLPAFRDRRPPAWHPARRRRPRAALLRRHRAGVEGAGNSARSTRAIGCGHQRSSHSVKRPFSRGMTFSANSLVLYLASSLPMLPNCSSSIRWPTLRSVATVGQLLYDLVGRADDHIAAIDDVLHLGRGARLLAGVEAGGAADLARRCRRAASPR